MNNSIENHRPGRVANLLLGLFAMALIGSFVGGLAISIGSLAFGIIALLVLAMVAVDTLQTIKDPNRYQHL